MALRSVAEFDPERRLIEATPDWYQYFVLAAPGVVYRTYPQDRPALEPLKTSVWLDDCTHGPVQTYDDGLFVGYIAVFDNCDGTATRVVQLEAHPRNGKTRAGRGESLEVQMLQVARGADVPWIGNDEASGRMQLAKRGALFGDGGHETLSDCKVDMSIRLEPTGPDCLEPSAV